MRLNVSNCCLRFFPRLQVLKWDVSMEHVG
jgi:hypothetical protein